MGQRTRSSLFIIFFVFLLQGIALHSTAQQGRMLLPPAMNTDPAALEQLKKKLDNGTVSEAAFLDSVDMYAGFYLNSPQFAGLLSRYRDIAWNSEQFRRNRVRYFLLMAAYSMNHRDYGSALFYYRKEMDEALSTPRRFSYVIKAYLGQVLINRDLGNKAQMDKDLKQGDAALRYIMSHKNILAIQPEDWAEICILLYNAQVLYISLHDATRAQEYYRQMQEIIAFINRRFADDRTDITRSYIHAANYKYQVARFAWHKARQQQDSSIADLHEALSIVTNSASPGPKDACMDIYSSLVDLYLAGNRLDSAAVYISLYGEYLQDSTHLRLHRFLQEENNTLHTYKAELYERRGDLPNALLHLKEASKINDSIYKDMTLDYYNNLYAKAQMVYNREQLVKTEHARNRTERTNLFLWLSVILIAITAACIFYWYKYRQQQRYIQSKLTLARNIHDEVAPMLLYTRMLAKAESQAAGTVPLFFSELDTQLSRTLDSVRMLAHELRSNEQYKLSTLCGYMEEQLKKNEKINKIAYRIGAGGLTALISACQYDHLKKIFSELVANTIKHTSCRYISVQLSVSEKMIRICYSDDGPGFTKEYQENGVGLRNMAERTAQMHGCFTLHNNYPKGYSISIEIPRI